MRRIGIHECRRPRAVSFVVSCALLLLAAGPAGVAAQDVWRVPASLEVGAVYRGWSITEPEGKSELHQWAFPIFLRTRLSDSVDFSYLFNSASSTLDFDTGESNGLSGITDGKLGVDYYLPDQRFSVGLGMRLPTGQSILTPTEDAVAQVIIDRMLGFYVRRYGEGTDLELRGGYASTSSSRLGFAGGLAFLSKGRFDVAAPSRDGNRSSYDPGDEFALYGGARYRMGARSILARLRFATFGTDRLDGSPELDEGTQLSIDVDVSQEAMQGVLRLGAEALFKGETRLFGEEDLRPLRDVGGNILRLDGAFSGYLTPRSTLGLVTAVGLFGETSSGTGDGFLFELGPIATYDLHRGMIVNFQYMWMTGNSENSSIDLGGHALSLSLAIGGVR